MEGPSPMVTLVSRSKSGSSPNLVLMSSAYFWIRSSLLPIVFVLVFRIAVSCLRYGFKIVEQNFIVQLPWGKDFQNPRFVGCPKEIPQSGFQLVHVMDLGIIKAVHGRQVLRGKGVVGFEKGFELRAVLPPWEDPEYSPSPIVDHNDPKIGTDILVPKRIAVIEKTEVPTQQYTRCATVQGSPYGGGGTAIDPTGPAVAKYLQTGIQVEQLGIAYRGTVGQMQSIPLGNRAEQLIENAEVGEGDFFQIVFSGLPIALLGLQPLQFIGACRRIWGQE